MIRIDKLVHLARAARLALAAIILSSLCLAPAQAQAQRGPEAERNRKTVDTAFARWAQGSGNFFDEVLDPEVVWTIKGSGPSAGVYRGRADLERRALAPFVARLSRPVRPERWRLWAEGDHVIAQWEGVAVVRGGEPYRNSYVWILRLDGGRATEVTAYLDLPAYDAVVSGAASPR